MHEELRDISRPQVVAAEGGGAPLRWVAVLVIVAILAAGVWMFVRARRQKDAQQMITRAGQLYEQRRLPEAYEVATRAAVILPSDPELLDLITKVMQKASIKTDPPGATVYLQRFKGPDTRERAGTTPLELPRLLRADYLVTVEKQGYAPATRPLSIAPIWWGDMESARMPGNLQIKMLPSASVPRNMVFVSGGPYRLQGWYRASDREVRLPDFFIDRYEVSNRDYAEFVRAGGYRRRELWKNQADVSRFVDTTGLPGPRTWAGAARHRRDARTTLSPTSRGTRPRRSPD